MNRAMYYKDMTIFFMGVVSGMILLTNGVYDLSLGLKIFSLIGTLILVLVMSFYDKIFVKQEDRE